MKVAIVSNWDEKCGNAEYAANLVKHIPQGGIEVKRVGRPLNFEHIYAETRDVDVIHFNCVFPEFRAIATETEPWIKFRDGGKKLTIMVQDSSKAKVEKTAILAYQYRKKTKFVFDQVAAHEDFRIPRVHIIPHGLLQVDTKDVPVTVKLGTAGFPMPWKGHVPAAYAARNLNLPYLAVMPASHHIEVEQTKNKVLELCPMAEVVTDWLTHEQIIQRLAECFVTVFAYDLDYLGTPMEGISGAVRFGLSAGRPIIISCCSLFRDLLEQYKDEVYLMDEGIERAVLQVRDDFYKKQLRVPKRIVEDMNWSTCATMYKGMWKAALTGV